MKRPAAAPRKLKLTGKESSATSAVSHWLLKSEPSDYSIDDLQREGVTAWDGVRNAVARANMRKMKVGDLAFFYHSSAGKDTAIVGTVRVRRLAYPDPVDERWCCVDVEFVSKFKMPISLSNLKELAKNPAGAAISGLSLFRQPRLSVVPVSKQEWTFLSTGSALKALENLA